MNQFSKRIIETKEVRNFFFSIPLAAGVTRYNIVTPANQHWIIQGMNAYMGDLKREQYKDVFARIIVQDYEMCNIPLVIIDDVARAHSDIENELAKRVCFLENKPRYDKGEITKDEFDDLLGDCSIVDNVFAVPIYVQAQSVFSVWLNDGPKRDDAIVPSEITIIAHGMVTMVCRS